jgi:pimeloyl-ACP methyl ester carboxylesterase
MAQSGQVTPAAGGSRGPAARPRIIYRPGAMPHSAITQPHAFEVPRSDTVLAAERTGAGAPLLLLHGLTATRRYVLHGSTALAREGFELIGYDARGHGASLPAADPTAYNYDLLGDDAAAVLAAADVASAALVGQSMGAATAVNLTLRHPQRVRALVVITPAHRGAPSPNLAHWDALAEGLEQGGVDGFLAAYGTPRVPPAMVETIRVVIRQRLERHAHPEGVVAALRQIPRSAAFAGLAALERIDVPTLIVASSDDMDAEHPLAVAEEYARRIPAAEFIIEEPGQSPLAWRGGSLSRVVGEFLGRHGLGATPFRD